MVKREPTPPIEDDCKYLIVHFPYPMYANMMREDHRIEFAHWIAACIGDRYLATLYFKPSVRNITPTIMTINAYISSLTCTHTLYILTTLLACR